MSSMGQTGGRMMTRPAHVYLVQPAIDSIKQMPVSHFGFVGLFLVPLGSQHELSNGTVGLDSSLHLQLISHGSLRRAL